MATSRGVITLDVGGTSIKSCVVCEPAQLLPDTIEVVDSMSHESSAVILEHFRTIILRQLQKAAAKEVDVMGIGLAFPGPFDYEHGVCLIRGLNKYESIYGHNLRSYLANAIGIPESNIAFMNDADAFALGESAFGTGQNFNKAIYLTLGTGIGSTFIEQGTIVNERAPFGGRMFQIPYRDGYTEDYVSRSGILRIARELGAGNINDDVVDLAERAVVGDDCARQVFHQFGVMLGEALQPVCDVFRPDTIVLGGQISKSADLFVPSLRTQLNTQITVTRNSLESTCLGMYFKITSSTDQDQRIAGGDTT